jgi:hypothetical protein
MKMYASARVYAGDGDDNQCRKCTVEAVTPVRVTKCIEGRSNDNWLLIEVISE